jgi:hypothetical protein
MEMCQVVQDVRILNITEILLKMMLSTQNCNLDPDNFKKNTWEGRQGVYNLYIYDLQLHYIYREKAQYGNQF